MKVIKSINILKKELKVARKNSFVINFIPTMGALHNGHMKLIKKAKKKNVLRIVSIYVNPAQFGPNEDFKNYPRTIQKDLLVLRNAKIDILFLPINKQIIS